MLIVERVRWRVESFLGFLRAFPKVSEPFGVVERYAFLDLFLEPCFLLRVFLLCPPSEFDSLLLPERILISEGFTLS